METIIVTATIAKVSTMADSGIRVSFDLPEFAIPQAAALMEFFRNGTLVRLAIAAADATPETIDA